MPFYLKLLLSIVIIITATQIGRSFPSLGGIIATMPLTGSIVLVWFYADNPGNFRLMESFSKGSLWGALISVLFFVTVYLCFRRDFSLTATLTSGFSVWLVGALCYQFLLK